MIVAFDNTFLSLAFFPGTKPTPNPATNEPVDHCELRVEALIDELTQRGDTVVIPTPCLSELLIVVPDISRAIGEISKATVFELASFDARAAYELSDTLRNAIAQGDKKSGVEAGWQQVKFDRQIVAIAKAHGATKIFTDDKTQSEFAQLMGLEVVHTWDLDLPPKYAQKSLLEDE